MVSIEDCNEDEIWDGSELKCTKEDWRPLIGDDKMPNRYWVMYSNNEYICGLDEDGIMCCEWDEDIESKGGVIAVFDSYRDAIFFTQNFREMEDTITIRGKMLSVTNKTIEDRLVGQVWEEGTYNYRYTKEIEVDERTSEVHTEENYLREALEEKGARLW